MFRRDANLGCLTFRTTQRLMNHDFRMFERVAFSFGTTRENHGSHRSREPNTNRNNIRFNVLYRIINRESRRYMSTWRIHIHCNWRLGVSFFEEQKLRNHGIGNRRINRITQKNNSILQKARINIIRAFLTSHFIDNCRNEKVRNNFFWFFCHIWNF